MPEILWYFVLFGVLLMAVLAMILPRNGFVECGACEEKETPISEEIDQIAMDCWALSQNGDLGERLCQAYQQAAANIEAAAGLIKRAEAQA